MSLTKDNSLAVTLSLPDTVMDGDYAVCACAGFETDATAGPTAHNAGADAYNYARKARMEVGAASYILPNNPATDTYLCKNLCSYGCSGAECVGCDGYISSEDDVTDTRAMCAPLDVLLASSE